MKRASDLFRFVICIIAIAALFYLYVFLAIVWGISVCRSYCMKPLKRFAVSSKLHGIFCATDVWAKRHGFYYSGMFSCSISTMAVWENPERATFLILYFDRKTPSFEFSTFFDESITLETGNRRELLWFPTPPGHFVQVFTDSGLHPLWQRHLETESYLIDSGNVTLTPFRTEFPWGNVSAGSDGRKKSWSAPQVAGPQLVRTQGRYLLHSWITVFILPFVIPYRNFFWSDKSVQQLIQSGQIVSPENLPSDYKKHTATWPPKKAVQKGEIRTNTIPSYCNENLARPKKRNAFMHWGTTSLAIIFGALLFYLMWAAIYIPSPTEATIVLQKEFRKHLFDLDEARALETASRIQQPYYREEAYAHTAWQQAETQQFDACRETMKKLTGKFRRHHSPPIQRIMQRHLALALAASDRFDEAEAARGDAWLNAEVTARICRYYLAADQTDRALMFLEQSQKSDRYYQTLREIVAKYTRQGKFEKAFDIVQKIELDGWRNSSLREIVHESLIRNEYENARKASDSFDLFRYRQQAAAIFMAWHLERSEIDAAWKIYEHHLVDATEDKRIVEQNVESPWARPDDWVRQDAIRQKLPHSRDDWNRIAANVFIRYGCEGEAQRILGFVPSPVNVTNNVAKISVEAVIAPTRDDLLRQLDDDFNGIRGNNCVTNEFLQQLESVLSHCQNGNEAAAVEALNHCWNEPLPHLFYPQYGLECRVRVLTFLFGAEIILGRFAEAEKMITRIGVTNTLENAVLRVRLAAALLAAQQFDAAQEQAKAATVFARRIDGATRFDNYIRSPWVQNVPEFVALPHLLDELQLHAESEEMRNRFAPSPAIFVR